MQILLANAKMMNTTAPCAPLSMPKFEQTANALAAEMATCEVAHLAQQLECSPKLAAEALLHYRNFFCTPPMPAIMAYNGQAYKHLCAHTLSNDALQFGQDHLWITCFLYGLLRPMDGIVPYRMEHCVRLKTTNDTPVNKWWKDKLTEVLIDSIKNDDDTLLHLSTEEYEHLFDWNRVCCEVRVIHPLFYVRQRDGHLKMQAVWAKACRGAMVRFVLTNQIAQPSDLALFEHEGFVYTEELGDSNHPHFVREKKN